MSTSDTAQVHLCSKALAHATTIASKTLLQGTISHPKQWCTPQLVKLLCQQDHAWHKAVATDSPECWKNHETLADLFHQKIHHIQTQAW